MEQKFYICKHCGNIIAKVKDAGVWLFRHGAEPPGRFAQGAFAC